MGRTLLAVIFTAALSLAADNISEQCEVHDERKITCRCIGNEELLLPDGYNYENISSVSVTGCASANLHFSTLTEASGLEEMIVQNISDRLNFEIFLTSSRMRLLRLSNIRRIPVITSDTFTTLQALDTLQIEDASIERLEEKFSRVNVSRFIMTNVTIEHINRLNFPEGGATLRIINSELRNVETSLNFANFRNIEIVGSKFELRRPGLVSVQGDVAVVRDSVFTNVSMNLVAVDAITIVGICADGKSTLRLSSRYIDSANNRLPNEIAYPRDSQQRIPEFFRNQNNTVCKAGNCKCPKSNGQEACKAEFSLLALACLLIVSLS